jgi:hypothetical protein
MRDTVLHHWLPALLVALAVALPGFALGTSTSTLADGTQPVLTSGDGDVGGPSHGDFAGSGVLGPYYYYATAYDVADYLEARGFYTSIRSSGGYWFVIYW